MTEEVAAEVVTAEQPAPEQIETASTETEVQAPEQTEQQPKTFTQEELDAAIGKRLAREQRKWEREQALKSQEAQQPRYQPQDISPEQFNSTEEYAEALAYRKAQEIIYQREQQRQFTEVVSAYHEREEDARSKYDDFEQVAYNPNLPISEVMAQAIQASENGPDIAYYLGSNPKEAERIFKLSPLLQAKELGKVEAKLANDPAPAKKTTNAPPPISPVTPRGPSNPAYDTTDPRSIKTMSTSEWIAAERERQRRKLEAAKR